MRSTAKKEAVPLSIFVHAKRMNWDSECYFLYASFSVAPSHRDAMTCRDTVPTAAGDLRISDLGFVLIVHRNDKTAFALAREVELEFREVQRVSARDAKNMSHTFAVVERKLHKLNERFGRPESFAASLRRVCDVLGVSEIAFDPKTIALYRKLHDWEGGVGQHGNVEPVRESVETAARTFECIIEEITASNECAEGAKEGAS